MPKNEEFSEKEAGRFEARYGEIDGTSDAWQPRLCCFSVLKRGLVGTYQHVAKSILTFIWQSSIFARIPVRLWALMMLRVPRLRFVVRLVSA